MHEKWSLFKTCAIKYYVHLPSLFNTYLLLTLLSFGLLFKLDIRIFWDFRKTFRVRKDFLAKLNCEAIVYNVKYI
jgi:hypothetical protein